MMINALITSRNNPSVKMVKGIVSKTISGFKKVLRKASTIAISKALVKLVTSTPGNSQETNITAIPDMRSFIRICPIELFFIEMQK